MITADNFSFSRKEKLKSKKQIALLFKEGKSVSAYPVKLIYLKQDKTLADPKIKVAVTVPKRSFNRAVDRNRIKRLLREAYRLNKGAVFNNIEGNFALLFLYLGKEIPQYQHLEKAMLLTLEKFVKQIQ